MRKFSNGSARPRPVKNLFKMFAALMGVLLLLGVTMQGGSSYAQEEGSQSSPTATEAGTPASSGAQTPSGGSSSGSEQQSSTATGSEQQTSTATGSEQQTSTATDSGTPTTTESGTAQSTVTGSATNESSQTNTAGAFDLSRFLVGPLTLKYAGQEVTPDADGKVTVHPDTPYQIDLLFKEKPDEEDGQIPSGKELMFKLPEGIQAYPNQKGKLDIETTSGIVSDSTWEIRDNVLYLMLSNDSRLTDSGQAQFFVTINVEFDPGVSGEVAFAGGVVLKVTVSHDPELAISKSAVHDFGAGKVRYTVTVNSINTNKNVVVTDTIDGPDSVLKLDTDPKTFNVKSSKKDAPKYKAEDLAKDGKLVIDEQGNGFTLTIPQMTHGERIEVTYSASVDYSKIDPTKGGAIEQTSNTVKVNSDQILKPKEAKNDMEGKLKIGTLTKKAGSAKQVEGEPGVYEQPWTINVNQYNKLDVAGFKIGDEIPEAHKEYMKYSGEGIKIVVNKGRVDDTGTSMEKTLDLNWANDLGITDLDAATKWEYTLPDTDPEKSSYEITYTTRVDVNSKIVPSSVSNTVTADDGDPATPEDSVTAGSGTMEPEHMFKVQKNVDSESVDEVTWQIVVDVVPQGYQTLVVEDTLPAAKTFQDKLKDDPEIKVEGLFPGEDYTLEKDQNKSFKLTFYQDAATRKEGLKANLDANGNPKVDGKGKKLGRQVKITFTTTNDQEWVTGYRAGDYSLYRHVNNVKATANDVVRDARVFATPDKEGLNKRFIGKSVKEIDGVDWPVFNFRISLEGINKIEEDTIIVTDEFGSSNLKLADDPKPNISGADISEVKEESGKITFKMKKEKLPKSPSGEFYSSYYLEYSLIPTSKAELDKINLDPNGLKLTNKAEWGPVVTKPVETEYNYDPLTKNVTEAPTLSNGYKATFEVTVNPSGVRLPNAGDTIQLTDDMTNLRLLPETLKMSPAKYDYQPMLKDGVLTMTVPNEQKVVITYQARVLGENVVNYSNKVSLAGNESFASGSVAVRLKTGGQAFNPGITLQKHDSRSLSSELAGAEFQLYRIKNDVAEPMIGKLAEDQAEPGPLVFTTDEHGRVKIQGNEGKLGWVLYLSDSTDTYEYELRETKAPAGYKPLTEPIRFTIKQMVTENNEFFDGEVVHVANDPVDPEDPVPPGSDDPNDPSKSKGKKHRLPRTGGEIGVAGIAGLALLGAAVIGVTARNRNRKN